jgi:hypothetical protein
MKNRVVAVMINNNTKLKRYNIDEVAKIILKNDKNIRNSVDYKNYTDELIDKTMSCDPYEAADYMMFEIKYVLSAGSGKKDLSLRTGFMAAYDLLVSIENM